MNTLIALFLLMVGLNTTHTQLVKAERYEQAIVISKLCSVDSTFLFYQAVASYKTKDYIKTSRCIKDALTMGKLAERHRVVLEMMQSEVERAINSKEKLLDISSDMDIIERRLRLGQAGSKTQDLQKEVIRKLDEEIKAMEDQMQKANADSGGQAKSQAPAGDSKIIETPGEGKVDNKKLVMTNDIWGKMPPKEKTKALEAINRQLPPHIREAAEGFTKKLVERK